ncbi:hypothetical protein HKX48_007311, partial [Thoreauomyces humboldtii]
LAGARASRSRLSSRRTFHSTPATTAAKRDAYEVLGVSKGATAGEMKKAYYKLARDYHPDTSKDPNSKEKFLEIQEAYDILSDDSKRANYDQFGHSAFGGGEGGPTGAGGFGGGFGAGGFGGFGGGAGGQPFGGNAQDIFEQLFTGFGGMPGAGGGGRGGFDAVGRSIKTTLTIPFMEAAKGTTRSIAFEAIRRCKPCTGSGLKPGHKPRKCGVCGGAGQISIVRGGFHMAAPCQACGGTGAQVSEEAKCRSCDGIGRVKDRREVDVKVPAGVYDGIELRLHGQGNAPLEGNGPDGDLFVRLKVTSHPQFKRDGADVLVDASVPLAKALLGGTLRIPTVDGDVELKIPAGTQPNERKRLPQRGVPKVDSRSSDARGDQWVTLKVELPRKLTPLQKSLLEQAFGASPKPDAAAPGASSKESRPPMHQDDATSTDKDVDPQKKGFLRAALDKLKKEVNSKQDDSAAGGPKQGAA